jgi:hypothetical protein
VVHEAATVRQLLGLTGQFAAVDEILSGRENLQMFGRLFDQLAESGSVAATSVPPPAGLSILSRPPSAVTRSPIPTSP